MSRMLHRLRYDDAGQDLVEYALLATFIALASAGGLRFLGNQLNALVWKPLSTSLP